MREYLKLLSFLALGSIASFAPLASTWAGVTLRAERSDARAKQQMAVSFNDSATARLTLNSNFLTGAAEQVELGYFEIDLEKIYPGQWKSLFSKFKNEEQKKPASKTKSKTIPHATRFYIGRSEFTEDSPTGQLILKTLREVWAQPLARVAKDTARATLEPGTKATIKVQFFGKNASTQPLSAPCSPRSPGYWSCEIPDYGYGEFVQNGGVKK